jgi:hypothetical protein
MTQKTALAAWSQSSLRPVVLPSGTKALIVLPDVNLLVRTGKIPEELTAIAMKFATTGISAAEITSPQEIMEFVRLTYALVADSLRYLALADSEAWETFRETGESPTVEGWETIAVDGPELAQMQIDQADIEALAAIAGRMKTPNEVTAVSRYDRGLLTTEGALAAIKPDVGQRVGDYAPFRGEPAGADTGADGRDVRATAVVAARSVGPGGRTRTRRSSRG